MGGRAKNAGREERVNCGVSHFDVESQPVDVRGAIVNEPLLRFFDDLDSGAGGELPPSDPPLRVWTMAESSEAALPASSPAAHDGRHRKSASVGDCSTGQRREQPVDERPPHIDQ